MAHSRRTGSPRASSRHLRVPGAESDTRLTRRSDSTSEGRCEPGTSSSRRRPCLPRADSRGGRHRESAVYPPLFVFAAVPLALLPFTAAAWAWSFVLALSVLASLWILRVRDWRCYVLAATSPPVLHGVFYGNLTLLLILPLALAWRYRDRAPLVGTAVGVAIAGELFVWPLLAWLLLTRRFRATAWALGATAALVVGVWSIIGFQGLRSYPALLRVVQDVYGVRSTSLATIAGGFGASGKAAVAIAATAGIVLLTAAVSPQCGARTVIGGRSRSSLRHPSSRLRLSLAQLRGPPARPDCNHLAAPGSGVVLRLSHLARRSARAAGQARAGDVLQARRCSQSRLGVEPPGSDALAGARGYGGCAGRCTRCSPRPARVDGIRRPNPFSGALAPDSS